MQGHVASFHILSYSFNKNMADKALGQWILPQFKHLMFFWKLLE